MLYIRVTLLNAAPVEPTSTLVKLIAWSQNLLQAVPEAYRDEVRYYLDYKEGRSTMTVFYDRPATASERDERLAGRESRRDHVVGCVFTPLYERSGEKS